MLSSGSTADEPLRLTPAVFRRFAAHITERLGIKMPENKLPMLQSRLQRRLRILGLRTIEDYERYLFESDHGNAEQVDFVNAVTTNKTDFFREPQHFEYLRQVALPALDDRPDAPWRFKLWCAGCSSGEEPYTLAMVLSEHAQERPGFTFGLLATDVSTHVLGLAREAVYEHHLVDPVPAALRPKYLLRSRAQGRDQVRIVPALRARVQFHELNLMDADYGVADVFDVIFFRNVMIYFDRPTQEAVVRKLCRHLRPGGYLFIGHSESLIGLDVPVQMTASAVYRSPVHP